MNTLFQVFNSIQNCLFPWLEETLDPLSEKEQKICPGGLSNGSSNPYESLSLEGDRPKA
jgi:hypothetical protein